MHRPDFVLKYSVLTPASVLLNSSRRIYRSNKAHHKSGNRHNAPCYNRDRMFSHNCKEHLLPVTIYNYPFTFFKKCVTAAFFQLNPAINTAAYKLKLPIMTCLITCLYMDIDKVVSILQSLDSCSSFAFVIRIRKACGK